MPLPPPSAKAQLEFLAKVERILAEGQFTTTYKFALLIAITNIAVEKGSDWGDELTIDLDDIARQFLSLYWNMARPYPLDKVLKQSTNSKKPATVMRSLSIACIQSSSGYARRRVYRRESCGLISKAKATIKRNVLYRLQSFGGTEMLRKDSFLYDFPRCAEDCTGLQSITLKAGASACLRRLRGVIVAMVQARWARWVRGNNDSLGADRALEAFMFGAERTDLRMYAKPLYELQAGVCFYSGEKLRSAKAGHVDHFIPWSRYPFDSPFNLVLASPAVNSAKRDLLAPPSLRKRWQHRNDHCFGVLTGKLFDAVPTDRDAVHAFAEWIYSTQFNRSSASTYAAI